MKNGCPWRSSNLGFQQVAYTHSVAGPSIELERPAREIKDWLNNRVEVRSWP
jgi:hypothetical protein